MGINRVLAVLSVAVLASCGQSSRETGNNTPTTTSPWHSLTETEINEAAAAVSEAFGEGIFSVASASPSLTRTKREHGKRVIQQPAALTLSTG